MCLGGTGIEWSLKLIDSKEEFKVERGDRTDFIVATALVAIVLIPTIIVIIQQLFNMLAY